MPNLSALEEYIGEISEVWGLMIYFKQNLFFPQLLCFVVSFIPMSVENSPLGKETKRYLQCHQVLYQLSQHNYGYNMVNCQRKVVDLFTTKFVDSVNAEAVH